MKDKVYYDGDCYVCSIEINALRKKGEKCGIEFIDIADKDFGNPEPYLVIVTGKLYLSFSHQFFQGFGK